jgi:O-antigen biosynthesis rhamnosyltransferase
VNVLHLYKDALPFSEGGVEQVIHSIASRSATLGCVSSVATTVSRRTDSGVHRISGGTYTIEGFYRTVSLASCPGSWPMLLAYPRLIANIDLVHIHFPWPFADIVHLLRGDGKPFVVTYHSDVVRQRLLGSAYAPLRDALLKKARAIVCTSSVLARFSDTTHVIPIGIADPLALPRPQDEPTFTAPLPEKFFLFVGVLRYYKGLHTLLEAITGTNINLVIAGDGPMRPALERQAAATGSRQVRFLGAVSDIQKHWLYSRCSGFVFPSHLRSEAFGVSLLEAAAHGRPLICCEIGTGTTLINQHGETGVVVPPSSAGALREAMTKILRDSASAERMGAAARARYLANFTADRMVTAYEAVYLEALARYSSRLL